MSKEIRKGAFIPSDMSEEGRRGFQKPPQTVFVYVSDMSEEGRRGIPIIELRKKEG